MELISLYPHVIPTGKIGDLELYSERQMQDHYTDLFNFSESVTNLENGDISTLNVYGCITDNGGFLDEDDMISDSSSSFASQQSIRAYVAANGVDKAADYTWTANHEFQSSVDVSTLSVAVCITDSGGVLDETDLVSDSSTSLVTQKSVKTYIDDIVAAGVAKDADYTWTGEHQFDISVTMFSALDVSRVYVDGTLDVNGDARVGEDLFVGDDLIVTDGAQFGGSVSITGYINPGYCITNNSGFLDEDDLASDSSSSYASQQSIKAYVDSFAGGVGKGDDVTWTADHEFKGSSVDISCNLTCFSNIDATYGDTNLNDLSVQGVTFFEGSVEIHDDLDVSGDIKAYNDMWFISSGSGLPYVTLFNDNNEVDISVVSNATWYEIVSDFTRDHNNNFDFTSDHAAVPTKEGRYYITFSLSLETASAGDEIGVCLMVNGTEDTRHKGVSAVASANDLVNINGNAIVDLNNGDQVSMAVRNYTAARDIKIKHGVFSLLHIGGT
jgi:hypothetical protein